MSRNECLKPKPHPKILGLSMPCRKCKSCIKYTQIEWSNRMKLETFQKPLPLFTTWTFEPGVYEDNPRFVLTEIQKLFKRLRKNGHKIRYFNVIERGKQFKRLHGHSIIWSPTIQALTPTERSKLLQSKWNNGIVDVQQARSAGALTYLTKYLTKDLHETLNHETGELKMARNYSWSQKPMLGTDGLNYWKKTVDHYHAQEPYTNQFLPRNNILMPIGNRAQTVYIPKAYWIDKCKQLGISFTPEVEKMSELELNSLIQKHGQTQKNKIILPETVLQRL